MVALNQPRVLFKMMCYKDEYYIYFLHPEAQGVVVFMKKGRSLCSAGIETRAYMQRYSSESQWNFPSFLVLFLSLAASHSSQHFPWN